MRGSTTTKLSEANLPDSPKVEGFKPRKSQLFDNPIVRRSLSRQKLVEHIAKLPPVQVVVNTGGTIESSKRNGSYDTAFLIKTERSRSQINHENSLKQLIMNRTNS